jgi:rhodanese-related sulfurtransferase/mannose-6-phosphate isomerase-like protein (cupin superfamily)
MQLATVEKFAETTDSTIVEHSTSAATPRTPEELAVLVTEFASNNEWLHRVRFRAEGRWYERLHHDADHDIWVISWLPGQSTGFHDHGDSAGAFVVTAGVLEEHRPEEHPVPIYPSQPRAFGPDYAHDVRNVSLAPAISIHAYSPPLDEMNEYELDGAQLVPRDRTPRQTDTLDLDRWAPKTTEAQSIEHMLSTARARLRRLSSTQANDALLKSDAILVDIRPEAQRAIEGTIEGAFIVERNVLEWRLDPTSPARLPIATHHHLQVIVFCSEGYTSSLAAASLQDLGLWRATDLVGGFQAWQASGLPIVPPPNP